MEKKTIGIGFALAAGAVALALGYKKMMQITRETHHDEAAHRVGHIAAAMSAPIIEQDEEDDRFGPAASFDLTS